MVNGAFGTGVAVFGTLLVADGWFCSCVSDGGVFGVIFVQPRMKSAVKDLMIFVSDFVEKCR